LRENNTFDQKGDWVKSTDREAVQRK